MAVQRLARAGVILLLLLMLLPAVSAQTQYSPCDGTSAVDDMACMFLPENTTLTPQMLLFGVVIPLLLTFAVIFYGMKNVLDRPEAFVVALGVSLFIIPSGASLAMGEVFLTIWNGIASVAGLPAVGGGTATGPAADEIWLWMNENGGAIAVLTGILMAIYFGFTDDKISTQEWATIPLVVGGVWFVLGGGEVLFQVLLWLVIFTVGLTVLKLPLQRDTGVLGKMISVAGLIIIGWTVTSFAGSDLLADLGLTGLSRTLEQFGNLILSLVSSLIILFVIVIGIAVFIGMKFLAAQESG